MITWILAGLLSIWLIVKRFGKDGMIHGEPLGMPRGTVRAFVTLLIITFPFQYLLANGNIPPLIINVIFVLVAFYFQARKGGKETIEEVIKEIKEERTEEIEEEEEKYPLYLPRYTVRISLVIILILIVLINTLWVSVPFEATNTLLELLLIVIVFFIGVFFRNISIKRVKKGIKKKIEKVDEQAGLTTIEILEEVLKEEKTMKHMIGRNIISIIAIISMLVSLLLYTFTIDYSIQILPIYTFSVKETLLLVIQFYYGFRD